MPLMQLHYLQEQKRRELEDMNRVLAELGIETQPVQDDDNGKFFFNCPLKVLSLVSGTRCCRHTIDTCHNVPTDIKVPGSHGAANGGEVNAGKKKKKKDKDRKFAEVSEPDPASSSSLQPEAEQHAVIDPVEVKKSWKLEDF